MSKQSKMPQIGEAVFCIIYLLFAFIAAILLLTKGAGRPAIMTYGLMTLVLAGGDAFHLVPRIKNAFGTMKNYDFYAGLGLLVSSVTMTVFYLILYKIWELLTGTRASMPLLVVLFGCALIRILLCLFPQNKWFSKEGNPAWGIYRNIPFVVVGLIMIGLFLKAGRPAMSLAILISFACYLPVVLWAKKNPKIGMLMMPKTMAYMWIIGMGLAML